MVSQQSQNTRRLLTNPVGILITWFGCGLVPLAPGTMGTIGAIPLAYVLWTRIDSTLLRVVITVILTALSCWLTGLDQKKTSSRDPQYVVIDEVAGLFWSSLLFPPDYIHFLIAFIAFRIFDVVKPWPASFFDRSSKTSPQPLIRGFHIVFDDVVAGFFAGATTWLFFKYIFPHL